ncbi:MAG: FtsX-like permease family protein [Desulfuromonadales bacterium]|nr:FtsX-like permease family protein [Desulfuromonadales bacterium]
MYALSYAWRNLWRNRRRTLITLSAIALSIMLVQAAHNLSFGVYNSMIDSGVRSGSGHIAIYRAGYLDSRDENLDFAVADLATEIAALPGVSRVMPRLYLPALAQSSRESRGVLLIGVDPQRELGINPFLAQLPDEEMVRAADSRDAVIGARLLDELRIAPGQKFVVTAQHRDGSLHSELLRVHGVIRTGMKDIDGSLIMIGRQRAGLLAGSPDRAHELAIVLESAADSQRLLPVIAGLIAPEDEIEAVSWEQAMPNLANAIKLDYASQKLIFVLILLIVTIGVVNTLLMSVMERMREFGTILALGCPPARLRRLIFLEAFTLGLFAAVCGTILGSLLSWYLVEVGLDLKLFLDETIEFGGVIFEPVLRAQWDPWWMLRIALYVVGLTVFAALYPAIKAGRVTPVEGMRAH